MAGARATPEARRMAIEWVKRNPTHPAAIAYMKQVANQNTYGGVTARRYMEQGLGQQIKPKPKKK